MSCFKKKATLTALVMLLLCGCGGHPLSEREIIRAVLFERSDGEYQACLLLEDKDVPEGEQGYTTATATGMTPAQALQNAEGMLRGDPYYGLMDAAMLPSNLSWQQAVEIGRLLYERAQPSPEIAVWGLQDDITAKELEEKAEGFYEQIQHKETLYGIHCGLEQLFAREEGCALPVYQKERYAFALLTRGENALVLNNDAAAQLAAVLCGQTGRMDLVFGGQNAAFWAKAAATVSVKDEGKAFVQLHLNDAECTLLTPFFDGENEARKALCDQWRQVFAALSAQKGDPMRLSFWASCRNGPASRAGEAHLEILFE
ncbi:MAG: hypothetical protein ACI4OI_08115 [Gemmiger sp.]